MTTAVHLLRHGEVDNPGHVLYGRLPGYHLSGLGVEQAEVAAEFLAQRPIGYLVASPLERAQETAAPLAALLGRPVAIDPRLIEAENKLEGRRVAGGRGLFTDVANWRHFRNPLRPSWGEPYDEIAARVLAAARSAARKVAGTGAEAVCVSHQLPIVAARRRAEGLPLFHDPRRRQCSLGSITTLVFDDEIVVGIEYAEPAVGVLPEGRGAGA